ncbi:ABC transporter ATP-binding protein [Ekhidna sp.]|uniref:ABC transporter ATP-binding protein n=1 Tax=Ekhidna sp. TaxID=2608089 RepID=UPI003299D1C4
MSTSVIQVEDLSKRYRLGVRDHSETLAGQVKNFLTYPLRNFKRITSLSSFDNEEDESTFWALRNINFEVKEGEVLGIIGHNGAGKSTLLKILSRITEPSSGQVNIRGRVSALLEVGTGFHPELSGRDNIYMNGTILGMRKWEIDEKLDEIIAFSGVEKHLYTPVKFYSSGMRVRLAFSIAAHLEPEILIIDEVLAVGDAEFQKKCLGKMEDVAGQGRTVLFVSHNLDAVKNLCYKGLLLKNGNIEFLGDVNSCIDSYQNITDLNSKFSPSGNKNIFIKKLEIRSASRKKEIIAEDPILIEFSFDNNVENDSIGTTIEIVNNFNQVICHQGIIVDKNSRKTSYTVRALLQGNILKSGQYSVNLFFGIRRSYILYKGENLISFELGSNEFLQRTKPGIVNVPISFEITSERK